MKRYLRVVFGLACGENAIKTKFVITAIFFLAVAFISTPVFANRYGNRSGDHFGYDRYSGHFSGNRYRHYFGGKHHDNHFGYHRSRPFPGHRGHYRHRHYRHPFNFHLGWLFWSPPPPPVYIYREYPETIIYREKYIYNSQPGDYLTSRNRSLLNGKSCLQTREYTTTIVIEGESVEAYGTKCLKPDGSWGYGPAQPVPDI